MKTLNNKKVLVLAFVSILFIILLLGRIYFYANKTSKKIIKEEALVSEVSNITIGDKDQQKIIIKNQNPKDLTWISEDENIVKVDNNGNITAVNPGHTRIIIKNKTKSLTIDIIVIGKNNNNDDDNNTDNDNNNNNNNNISNDNDNNKENKTVVPEQLSINKNTGKIVNGNGKNFVLKGVVLPNVDTNQFKASVNKTTLKSLRDNLGVNTIRFTLSPTSKMNYSEAFTRIKAAIDNASDLGIYVVVDWGVMKATIGDPRKTLSKANNNGLVTSANNFFESISKYAKDNPYVLYEICNEPNIETGKSKYINENTWDGVREYADTIIPIIRKNSNNIIIVAGRSGVVLNEIIKNRITKYNNIAYTFHLYPYNYDIRTYGPQLEKAIEMKIPIIATEMSIIDASLNNSNKTAYNIEKMNKYLELFSDKRYPLNFMYFKFDFPFEKVNDDGDKSIIQYREWSILKPIHSNYYDTRCKWNANKNLDLCKVSNTYVRHMSNLNLDTSLSKDYFCASNDNKCSKYKGEGVYTISGIYFVKTLMKRYQ